MKRLYTKIMYKIFNGKIPYIFCLIPLFSPSIYWYLSAVDSRKAVKQALSENILTRKVMLEIIDKEIEDNNQSLVPSTEIQNVLYNIRDKVLMFQ